MGSRAHYDYDFDFDNGGSDDSGVASSSASSKYYWSMEEEPLSVIDQAAQETARDPESSRFLLGRVFGAPETRIRPCKTCCPVQFTTRKKKGDGSKIFLGWTANDYENMTDTCPTHYVKSRMEEHALIRANMEAHMKKIQKLTKQETKYQSKAIPVTKKTKAMPKEDEEDDEDDDNTYKYVYDPRTDFTIQPKKKTKQTRWNCPKCEKSSKFGSAGCYSCGEWYHFNCAGFRTGKEIPKNWICEFCR